MAETQAAELLPDFLSNTDAGTVEAPAAAKVRIGEHLMSEGLISKGQLHVALAEQKVTRDKLGLILVRNGFITQRQLHDVVLKLNPGAIAGEAHFSKIVPPEVLLDLGVMVISERQDQVFVATSNSERLVRHMLKPYYGTRTIAFSPYEQTKLDVYLSELRKLAKDKDAVLERLLRKAIVERASDLHIEPRPHSYSVRGRFDGKLSHIHEGSLAEYLTISAQLKDRSRMDLAERRIPQDGGFSFEHNGASIDLRVASVPTVDGEKLVIRILDREAGSLKLEQIGISGVDKWRRGISMPNGLCLVCGPTGSGKTTTLAATLQELDRYGRAIWTAEDPVEYRHSGIAQVSINHTVGLDFARAIRAFMRADPDIIVLGEIRDEETGRNAIKGAETGHIVLGSLHTNSVISTFGRLRDLGIPAAELIYTLRVIMVQRLLRLTCTYCGGEGCHECGGRGTKGRTVVSEVAYFPNEESVRQAIAGQRTWNTMMDDAMEKVRSGLVMPREVADEFGHDSIDLMRELGLWKE